MKRRHEKGFCLLLSIAFVVFAPAQIRAEGKPTWKLDFFIVDERGKPLPEANILVAYVKNENPNVKVTPANWTQFLARTNVLTDSNGVGTVSDTGSPDQWQCFFTKPGFQRKEEAYIGPSDFVAIVGPGPANQKHTIMLVRTNAAPWTYPKWTVTLKAIDPEMHPIAGATATVQYRARVVSQDPYAFVETNVTGLTDSKGFFVLSAEDPTVVIGLDVTKTGYYKWRGSYEFGYREQYDPSKWNPTVPALLKKIINPIPMFVNRVDIAHQKKPALDTPIGFDLSIGDWVAPYGKGTNTHMRFTWHVDYDAEDVSAKYGKQRAHGWDGKLTITFPNPGDGIEEFRLPGQFDDGGSELRSANEAPTNGYQSQLVKLQSWHPNRAGTNTYDHLHINYYLRVQTVMDAQRNIKSAQYGKINGDFEEVLTTFLNPTANSRDLEFDGVHNLAPPKRRR